MIEAPGQPVDKSSRLLTAIARVRSPADLWRIRELRYLLVGGFNTLFNYGMGVWLYLALLPELHILIIGVIASVPAITVSFATHKILVFQTRGRWLSEYLKSYLVYGGSAVLGILLMWLLVSGLAVPIWIARGYTTLIDVVMSYLGHANFTFRRASSGKIK